MRVATLQKWKWDSVALLHFTCAAHCDSIFHRVVCYVIVFIYLSLASLFWFSSPAPRCKEYKINTGGQISWVITVDCSTHHGEFKWNEKSFRLTDYLCLCRNCIASRDPYCGWTKGSTCSFLRPGTRYDNPPFLCTSPCFISSCVLYLIISTRSVIWRLFSDSTPVEPSHAYVVWKSLVQSAATRISE